MSVDINSVRWKNFLATGNSWTKIDVASSTMTSISGTNGSGKCLRVKTTYIEVSSTSDKTLNDFRLYLRTVREAKSTPAEDSICCTLEELIGFIELQPDSEFTVKTKFGFKEIEAIGMTAANSEILRVETSDGHAIECSPDHLLWSRSANRWVHARNLNPGDLLEAQCGSDLPVASVQKLGFREDLYDIQVADVKEFYANGIRTHNSTFLDAISFGLYNKPFRKINKPQLINSINGRDCIVEIEFEVAGAKYLIRRGIKPAIFEIIKDGTLIDQSAANLDYQDILETQILRMNHRTFCQVAILGSANFVPFMQLSASQRREVVEDLLDIQIFSKMNSVLKQHLQASKESIADAKSRIATAENGIRIHEKHLSRILTDASSRVDRAREQIAVLHDQLSTLTSQFEEPQIEDPRPRIDQLVSSIAEIDSLKSRLNTKFKSLGKTQAFFEENHHCPTCEQTIAEDFRQEKLHACQTSIREVDAGILKLDSRREKMQNTRKEFAALEEEYAEAQRKHLQFKSQVSSLQSEIRRAEAALAQILDGDASTKEDTQAEIATLERSLVALTDELSSHLRRNDVLNMAAFLLKDGGIKAKIIRQYIPVINKLVNKYLAAMDFFIQFEFDENFTETIKSKYREDFSYASFSEGEKARINIALLFAWRAVAKMRNSASTNLLVLDEVFDGALDSVGTDELMGILETFTQGTNAFVITHREALIEKFPHSIQFEKQGNFSVML